MKIDVYKKAIGYKFYFPILLIFSISSIVYAYVDKGISLDWLYYGFGVVFFVIYLFLLIKKPFYFFFESLHSSLIVKFYNPHPFFSKPKVFNIPIKDFNSYEIRKKLLGFQKFIVFSIKKGKKTGEYPPVSISLLSETEIIDLKKELDTLLKMRNLK